ncbi:MAG: succinate dehydrogenase, cytochrome b556 subunit [Alphaproteobacteria bacterium]
MALFYHLCNGVRHLAWDAGRGFELTHVYATGRIVVGASVGLTIVAWIIGYALRGG